MRRAALAGALVALAAWPLAAQDGPAPPPAYNPYARAKNGPPLAGLFAKARPAWIWRKLREPRHHAGARMPELELTDDEAVDVMAFLRSVAEPLPAGHRWPAWADQDLLDLSDTDLAAADALMQRGRAAWGDARCSICHVARDAGGALVGGFVDLRVGGMDLQIAGDKLRRDWLYDWLRDPLALWPETLMPRTTLSDADIRGLVEYLLRDDAFRSPPGQTPPATLAALDDPARIARGRHLVELSRCILCHEIPTVAPLLPPAPTPAVPPAGTFARVTWDRRCLTCHALDGQGGTYAPDLSAAGSRLQQPWIAAFVQAPDTVRPLSQQMPRLGLSAAEGDIVARYLSGRCRDARVPDTLPDGPPTPAAIARGPAAFRAHGCDGCHTVDAAPGGLVGPALGAVGDRLRPAYLAYHLQHPHALRPDTAEPERTLPPDVAADLAAWLSTRTKSR